MNSELKSHEAAPEHIIDLDGLRLSICRVINSASKKHPVIVYLHDSLGSISAWGRFPQLLCEHTSCDGLIYDRQGHGRSDPIEKARKPDYHQHEVHVLIALLQKLGMSDVILFGHSDGGTIALLAAAMYPLIIRGVVSEAGHVFNETVTQDGIRAAKVLYDTNEKLHSRLRAHHGEKAKKLLEIWTDDWLLPEFLDWNIEAFLPLVKCPVLVIQGENDDFGTVAQVESICSRVSGSSDAYILPQTGHVPHKQAVNLVLERTSRFIESVVAAENDTPAAQKTSSHH